MTRVMEEMTLLREQEELNRRPGFHQGPIDMPK